MEAATVLTLDGVVDISLALEIFAATSPFVAFTVFSLSGEGASLGVFKVVSGRDFSFNEISAHLSTLSWACKSFSILAMEPFCCKVGLGALAGPNSTISVREGD